MAKKKNQPETVKGSSTKVASEYSKTSNLTINYTKQFSAVLLLVILNLLVFLQVLDYPFIGYDDNLYISDNPLALSGLSWQSIKCSPCARLHARLSPPSSPAHLR